VLFSKSGTEFAHVEIDRTGTKLSGTHVLGKSKAILVRDILIPLGPSEHTFERACGDGPLVDVAHLQ
jgi:hypothetical protein